MSPVDLTWSFFLKLDLLVDRPSRVFVSFSSAAFDSTEILFSGEPSSAERLGFRKNQPPAEGNRAVL